jgi:hypothetical protein
MPVDMRHIAALFIAALTLFLVSCEEPRVGQPMQTALMDIRTGEILSVDTIWVDTASNSPHKNVGWHMYLAHGAAQRDCGVYRELIVLNPVRVRIHTILH